MSPPATLPGGDRVEVACWLAPGLLALLTSVGHLSQPRQWRLQVELGGASLEPQMRLLRCVGAEEKQVRPGWLFTLSLPPGLIDAPLGAVALIAADERRELSPESVGSLLDGPQQLGIACRARFDAATRLAVQEFLAASPTEHGIELTAELAANLATVRDAVRDPLPTTELEDELCSARLEAITALSERCFWIVGWVHEPEPRQIAFTAVSPEGSRYHVPPAAVSFHPRPADSLPVKDDGRVITLGYYAYVELEHPSCHPYGWVMEFRTSAGCEIERTALGPASLDTGQVRELLTTQLDVDHPTDEEVFGQQVLPVMSSLRAGLEPRLRRLATFGVVAANPRHSVVAAVRRFDRIDHQLLSFAHDLDFADAELIFVVPPSEDEDLEYLAEGLHDLYGLPFVLAIASAPLTRARAFNLGAGIAHADVLVLMGGNVFPSSDGWIGRLRDVFDSSGSMGVVGATLKHEDDTIAYAGITYVRGSGGRWRQRLPLVGLDRRVLMGCSARETHAVSDGCLMIDHGLFEQSGGFSELYLDRGDEAGDMCVRLGATAQVWYAPEVELYLLDEDPPAEISRGAARFNEWLFERRCAPALKAMTAEEPGAARVRVPDLPPIPVYGSGQEDPPTEILRLRRPPLDKNVFVDAAVQAPTLNHEDSSFLNTYAVAVWGWVIPTSGTPATVELYRGTELLDRTLSDNARPHVGERYPDIPIAGHSGFSLLVSSLSLPYEFELSVVAVSSDGLRVPLATIHGRRRRVASAYRPRLQPLILSTLGRSGSSWLMLLLSQHPEIITMNPFQFEAKLTSYYTELLRAVAAPASYGQALLPEISDAHWWLGSRRRPMPAMLRNPGMPRWLGSENVEILAGFCQSRFDGFYLRQAELEQRYEARYFAEKAYPGAVPETIAELYPDGREVVLVRDMRDMFCSIVDYNAKRGFQLWGRDGVETEEQWFQHLRGETSKLLDGVRARSERVQIVRYEDLITDPQSTLDALLSYLGLSAEPEPETVRRMLDEATARQPPEGQRAHQTSLSVASSIGRWKTDLSDERRAACASAFDDILVEFGYEPTESAVASR